MQVYTNFFLKLQAGENPIAPEPKSKKTASKEPFEHGQDKTVIDIKLRQIQGYLWGQRCL